METPLDATVQPNIALQTRALGGTQQWVLGKPFGYAALSELDDAGLLGEYLERGRTAMDRAGQLDAMINEAPSPRLNTTMSRVVTLMGAHPPRSLLTKHALGATQNAATEPAQRRGGSIILSDPVHAPTDPETNDIDVPGTVAAVLASAKRRKLLWVFLDHQMTAGPLERVMDTLAKDHAAEVALVNLDQALRLCETSVADCYRQPKPS